MGMQVVDHAVHKVRRTSVDWLATRSDSGRLRRQVCGTQSWWPNAYAACCLPIRHPTALARGCQTHFGVPVLAAALAEYPHCRGWNWAPDRYCRIWFSSREDSIPARSCTQVRAARPPDCRRTDHGLGGHDPAHIMSLLQKLQMDFGMGMMLIHPRSGRSGHVLGSGRRVRGRDRVFHAPSLHQGPAVFHSQPRLRSGHPPGFHSGYGSGSLPARQQSLTSALLLRCGSLRRGNPVSVRNRRRA